MKQSKKIKNTFNAGSVLSFRQFSTTSTGCFPLFYKNGFSVKSIKAGEANLQTESVNLGYNALRVCDQLRKAVHFLTKHSHDFYVTVLFGRFRSEPINQVLNQTVWNNWFFF